MVSRIWSVSGSGRGTGWECGLGRERGPGWERGRDRVCEVDPLRSECGSDRGMRSGSIT
jgi:hypothetical protein